MAKLNIPLILMNTWNKKINLASSQTCADYYNLVWKNVQSLFGHICNLVHMYYEN